ncbi:MAG: UDP-N-acetylglucosamine 2-epimerase (non-hydrolyzing) [Acidobacteria bacterium]|nr:MAG: UDP-N-acetylglucosamine 2-epimerase (non-hydrolyzing) [Acidobacteriota bacterium]
MPVVRALEAAGAPPAVYVTGQHRELLAPILADLALVPAEDLGVMQPNQALGDLSARLLMAVQELLRRRRPGTLVVQGDTTSAAMGALAAFYEDVRVAHVEAGLRTGKRRNPFPEEMNRRLVACVADLHFAPTPRARDNLLAENVPAEAVHLVGNTVVDALFHARDRLVPGLPPDPVTEPLLRSPRALVLVTAHRRESFGPDLLAIAAGLKRLAEAFAGRIEIVYPVHLNPNVDSVMRAALAGVPGVHLTPPLPYLRFLQLLLRARLVITDSGGVQEEASALGIPFLCARRASERLEAVEAGVGEMVGPEEDALFGAAARLLGDDAAHARRARPTKAFGDGRAGERIARVLLGTRG